MCGKFKGGQTLSLSQCNSQGLPKYFLYLDSGSGVTNGARLSHSLGEMYSSWAVFLSLRVKGRELMKDKKVQLGFPWWSSG